ncbi:MAG: hypothetical protein KDJ65_17145 [Anaerolineae bacterium]|nr:hypothetical protein [Anaerolineae bacterium]
MAKNNQASLINRGLDKFSHFLSNELAQVTNLAAEIPDQAYIFHGSYNDPALTEVEIEKAADLLVRMQLGVEEEAPVIIVFEYAPQQYRIVDFATDQRKRQAQEWLQSFRQQSRQAIDYEINH